MNIKPLLATFGGWATVAHEFEAGLTQVAGAVASWLVLQLIEKVKRHYKNKKK